MVVSVVAMVVSVVAMVAGEGMAVSTSPNT